MLEISHIARVKVILRKTAGIILYISGAYFALDKISRRPGIYILNYHRLVDKKPSGSASEHDAGRETGIIPRISADCRLFEKQIAYFKKRYKLISMSEAVNIINNDAVLEKDCMVITFDDGYRDNYAFGKEIFIKHCIKPVIYVTAGPVEYRTPLWPDILRRLVYPSAIKKADIRIDGFSYTGDISNKYRKIKLVDALIRLFKKMDVNKKQECMAHLSEIFAGNNDSSCRLMLDWDEIRELVLEGAEIGSHTMNHPVLSNLTKADIRNELYSSKALMEKRLEREVEHFAYPNGKKNDYNPYALKLVQGLYKSAVTTVEGINYPGESVHKLKRAVILYDMSLTDIKVKLLRLKIMEK